MPPPPSAARSTGRFRVVAVYDLNKSFQLDPHLSADFHEYAIEWAQTRSSSSSTTLSAKRATFSQISCFRLAGYPRQGRPKSIQGNDDSAVGNGLADCQ